MSARLYITDHVHRAALKSALEITHERFESDIFGRRRDSDRK